MAKLSVHGSIIGTIDFCGKSKRYMSDGKVLANYGYGWKIHGSVKAGVTPQAAYDNACEKMRLDAIARPAFAAYRKELLSLTSMCNRAKLHLAVQLMPQDSDGVWSECCDGYQDNVHADCDEIGHLCHLYQVACAEKSMLASQVEVAA